MTAKKERGRFSLRFNIGDPVQRAAVELLELQPPHSKAQYIANALVYYNTHFSDDPQPLKVPAIDLAKTLKADDYTAASYKALSDTIASAEKVYAETEPSAEAVQTQINQREHPKLMI